MARTPPLRSLVAAALAGLLLVAAVLVTPPGTAAGTQAEEQLKEAKEELRETKERIRSRAKKLRIVKRELNRLATRIARNHAQVNEARKLIAKLEARIGKLQARLTFLEAQLDERSRSAYILGPGVPVLYLLTATSASDAVTRVSFLSEMNRRDAILAAKVGNVRARLSTDRAQVLRLERARELALQELETDRRELRRKLAASEKLFEALQRHKETVIDEISLIRPFGVCPVDGPIAISDSFGIWVQRSKERGGDHVHQGNDIMAPMGTPIRAPFDGLAETSENKLGGMAVKVFGEFGYVYNAHLSQYGQLGPVETGDVIGYVGATGNAGGPHNHFEWHPDNGDAADPYDYLLLVC